MINIIFGWDQHIQTISAIAALKKHASTTLAQAKGGIETVLRGGIIVLECGGPIPDLLGLDQLLVEETGKTYSETRYWELEGHTMSKEERIENIMKMTEQIPTVDGWVGLSLCARWCREWRRKDEHLPLSEKEALLVQERLLYKGEILSAESVQHGKAVSAALSFASLFN